MRVAALYEKLLAAVERQALTAACLVALSCAGAVAWLLGTLVVSDVTDIRGTEPYFVAGIQKITAGMPLYTPPTQPPFDNACYSPLYYLAAKAIAQRWNLPLGDVYGFTAAGRALSGAATVLFVLITFLFLRYRLKVDAVTSTLACCLVFICQAPWNVVVRPDALASLLGCTALYCGVVALQGKTGKGLSIALLAVAVLLGIAAAFTKQNAAVYPTILLLLLLLRRDWLRLTGTAFTAAVVLALLLTPRISGDVFLGSILGLPTIAGGGIDPGNVFAKVITPLCLDLNMPVVFGIGAALFLLWGRPGSPAHRQLMALAFVGLFGVAAVTSMKLGSAYHYFNDSMTVAVTATAYGLSALRRVPGDTSLFLNWRPATAVFVVLFLPAYTLQLTYQYGNLQDHIRSREETATYLRKAFEGKPGALLFTSDNTLANYFPERVTVPNLHTAVLHKVRGGVDFTPLQDCIDAGRVAFCALGVGQTPQKQLGFLGVRGDAFVFVENVGGFSIWKYAVAAEAAPPPSPPNRS